MLLLVIYIPCDGIDMTRADRMGKILFSPPLEMGMYPRPLEPQATPLFYEPHKLRQSHRGMQVDEHMHMVGYTIDAQHSASQLRTEAGKEIVQFPAVRLIDCHTT